VIKPAAETAAERFSSTWTPSMALSSPRSLSPPPADGKPGKQLQRRTCQQQVVSTICMSCSRRRRAAPQAWAISTGFSSIKHTGLTNATDRRRGLLGKRRILPNHADIVISKFIVKIRKFVFRHVTRCAILCADFARGTRMVSRRLRRGRRQMAT